MTFAIKKNEKYVKDFTEGKEFTRNVNIAEKYMNKKSALIAAMEYGRKNGAGYSVIELY